jgi:ribonuclease E
MEELENGRAATGPPTAPETVPESDGPHRAAPRGRGDGPDRYEVATSLDVPAPRPSRPRIGDTRPAPVVRPVVSAHPVVSPSPLVDADALDVATSGAGDLAAAPAKRRRRRGGRDRKGRSTGRYLICVHVQPGVSQIAVLEGRSLVQHFVSHAQDETTQIDGNIYVGRVQNVLPGMEAAFVDIGIPKNAVLYRGDVRYDTDDVESQGTGGQPRIEQLLRPGQSILCQVTKNPIGAKGARLTQEVSLPGRFVVLVPNSSAYGISKRLDDAERRRLRRIVDAIRPEGHGLIVRTAAAGASAEELQADVERLTRQWEEIATRSTEGQGPQLLYREPAIAVRVIREELNREYRAVVIDDLDLYEQVRDYVEAVNPELADRVEYFDAEAESLPVFERYHVHEQLHKALDRKVWLPSGGSLVIDRTEALTVIDVNTGKNVGTTNLEETVYRNNLEAAEEVARQLRLRDIGGIIVIDFIDMEVRENRDKVGAALRSALARDKTRTQVFDISELGLVEMTRKRVSEGLIESMSTTCAVCGGRGIVFEDPED